MPYYGIGVYGVATYDSVKQNLKGITQLYLGCEVVNGQEANGIFDEVELFFVDKSDADITAMFNAIQPSTWTSNHQLLAHLNNSLDAGNLLLEGVSIDFWRIYKKKSSENQYNLMLTVINNTSDYIQFTDYETANNNNYDYAIEGVSNSGIVTNKYEITNISINFNGIWVVDKNTGQSFQFRYNIPDLIINTESDRSEIKTLGKRPIVVRGQYKAKKGSLQADLINTTNPLTVYQQVQQLENLEGSNNLILKIDNGEILKVDIYNISHSRNPESKRISNIKCDYIQIGDVV